MSDREFIYRHQTAAPWNKTDGASLRLPVKDDSEALAVSFVYWPKGRSDGSAHDTGGFIFEICEWCKVLSADGEKQWDVKFRKAIEAAGTVNGLFNDGENVGLARGVRELFGMNTPIEVEGFIAETKGEPYLAIKGAKDAMARFYGIDSTAITVTLQE
ncbi:hypothetical protein [Pseudomonas hunanensis]|uniref:hypothetical protein n=1 Tax=Pseudomonas hunanensis TaxID=1247546 RepID=UPI0030D7DBCA